MYRKLASMLLFVMSSSVVAQTTYDSSTLVDTNNNSTSTSTINSTNNNINQNNNVNTTTVDSVSTNTNVNTNTSTNTNYNYGDTSSTNNNNNVNTSTSTSTSTNVNTSTQDVRTDNRNDNYNKSDINQKIEQPPPTAIAPSMMSGGNSDLCTTGVSGAVQTQILGISGGGTIRDLNCERLKLSKTLYDMGMKVAAVSTLCQDRRVFDAMWAAGTPCPFDGKIGAEAKELWDKNPGRIPEYEKVVTNDTIKTFGAGIGLLAIILLLL
jgi:hypothetical protein